jgi:hypothetical protein
MIIIITIIMIYHVYKPSRQVYTQVSISSTSCDSVIPLVIKLYFLYNGLGRGWYWFVMIIRETVLQVVNGVGSTLAEGRTETQTNVI